MIACTTAGHFLRSCAGEIFLLVRRPPEPRGAVLVVPPFAEEMNKCRRMVTEVALQLCSLGLAVLVPDLYGTGDSYGDFADGRWEGWQGDLQSVCAWSKACGLEVRAVLAIRLGAALAISAARSGKFPNLAVTAFWQPVLDGEKYLTQFLRLRTAGNLTGDGKKETVAELRSRLLAGESLEIAGYVLSGGLATDLDALGQPEDIASLLGALHWMEIVRTAENALPSASRGTIERLRTTGTQITEHTFIGEPFWATVEIARVPQMVTTTAQALAAGAVGAHER